jgi:anti-anti-sigma regulatory factor
VSIHGRLSAEIAAQLQDATTASILNGLVMVVHLNEVGQVTAAGLGVLLGARRQLLEAGLSLSLAGLNLKKRFVLRAWNLHMLFDEWQPAISRGRPLVAEAGSPVHVALPREQDVFPADTPWGRELVMNLPAQKFAKVNDKLQSGKTWRRSF